MKFQFINSIKFKTTMPLNFFVMVLTFSLTPTSHAGIILGGSSILNSGSVTQLENFLGQGTLELTNIFTKQQSDSSSRWHSLVDGQGPTFTLLELDNGKIIGGYNSSSWSSTQSYDATASDSFLFSLTTNFKHNTKTNIYYTYNNTSYGPTFGGGHDLYLNSSLSGGYANLGYTYQCRVGSYGSTACRNDFTGTYNNWSVTAMETFTIAAYTAPVSEPSIVALMALSFAGIGFFRKKKAA